MLMADTANPYATRLDILYPQLEIVDIPALVDACTFPWYNQTLVRMNESVVRLGIVKGEYHWHQHDDRGRVWSPADSLSTSRTARWSSCRAAASSFHRSASSAASAGAHGDPDGGGGRDHSDG
jgi:hypothetical protein